MKIKEVTQIKRDIPNKIRMVNTKNIKTAFLKT